MTFDFAKYARDWRAAHPGRVKEQRARWKASNPASYLHLKSRQRAKKAGMEYSLTVEWIAEHLTLGFCEATGLPFCFELGTAKLHNPWSPSIDRKSSSEGYTPDNCRIVVWAYNCAKASWDDEVVMRLARALTGALE